MIAGAVTVGSSSGEIPRVIGDCGRIFPEGDAAALARVLRELAENSALVRELRQKARERALATFTNQVVADKFADLFQLIWSNRKAHR
jgi:glycosyltransferase involved in cell wall biosynthesis